MNKINKGWKANKTKWAQHENDVKLRSIVSERSDQKNKKSGMFQNGIISENAKIITYILNRWSKISFSGNSLKNLLKDSKYHEFVIFSRKLLFLHFWDSNKWRKSTYSIRIPDRKSIISCWCGWSQRDRWGSICAGKLVFKIVARIPCKFPTGILLLVAQVWRGSIPESGMFRQSINIIKLI